MTLTPSAASTRPDHASALRRLREAQDDHDAVRRAFRAGVTSALLSADQRRWAFLGEAITELAALIAQQCGASHFCDARPDVGLLAIRISESIDDLMDTPAWSVVDAAARLAASEQSH